MNENPKLNNESYVLYDRVMNPLAAQQERKPKKDRGTRRGRHTTSSSSAFDQPYSSHLNDDDDDGNGEGTSRASTPSPICYVNSLTNQVPQIFLCICLVMDGMARTLASVDVDGKISMLDSVDHFGSICVKNGEESVLKVVKTEWKTSSIYKKKLNRIGNTVAMEQACKSNGTGDAPWNRLLFIRIKKNLL
ncbi:hypothetical protein Tco_0914228 [Tanacetum coccineum]